MVGIDLSQASAVYVGSTPASAVYLGSNQIWGGGTPTHDYSQDYFTIESLEDSNDVYIKSSSSSNVKTIEVSVDDGQTWTSYTSNTSGVLLGTLDTGEKMLFRGSNNNYGDSSGRSIYIYASNWHKMYGNILSLISPNFKTTPVQSFGSRAFYKMFKDNTGLTDIQNLVFPSFTSNYCYYSMFDGCSYLETVSALPATILSEYCYTNMFQDCITITATPTLPATALAENCYSSMFQGCAGLTTVSALPATILAASCYSSMFKGCIALVNPPIMAPTTVTTQSCKNMFYGCTNLASAPTLPAMAVEESSYDSMFYSCRALTTAPNLPATTLGNSCYNAMFRDCRALLTAPSILPATLLTQSCYNAMFRDCRLLQRAPELPAATLEKYCYGEMFRDCRVLNYIKCLATDMTASGCLDNWTNTVNATGTFVKDTGATWSTGNSGIPSGWTVETPTLPNYLKITSYDDDNAIKIYSNSASLNISVEASVDDGATWTSYTATTSGTTIATLDVDDEVLVRGNNESYVGMTFHPTGVFRLSGNIMSLINKTTFESLTQVGASAFKALFNGCSNLLQADDMELPATTVGAEAYYAMFAGCTSMTYGPDLPATTLGVDCYNVMFTGCSSLLKAPELPALILTERCYYGMFSGCTALNHVIMYATDISASNCLAGMMSNAGSTGGFFEKKASVTLHPSISLSPSWDVEDIDNYENRYLCIKVTAAGYFTIAAVSEETSGMTAKSYEVSVNNSAWESKTTSGSGNTWQVSQGDILRLRGTNTTYGYTTNKRYTAIGIADKSTVVKTDITQLTTCEFDVEGNIMSLLYGSNYKGQTAITDTFTFCSLFKLSNAGNCINLKLPAQTLTDSCYRALFSKALRLLTAPVLPAVNLATQCYKYMFENCSNIDAVTCLAETGIDTSSAVSNWLTGVAASGVLTKSSNTPVSASASTTSWLQNSVNGLPTGWTSQNAS